MWEDGVDVVMVVGAGRGWGGLGKGFLHAGRGGVRGTVYKGGGGAKSEVEEGRRLEGVCV